MCIMHGVTMRKPNYGEKKVRRDYTLTPTAIAWLIGQGVRLGATSESDSIEKLARENQNV